MADRNYVTTPEAWTAFRNSSKEKKQTTADDFVLTKADKTRHMGLMKSRDDVAAFLAKAPEDVRAEAVDAFPEKAANGESGDVVAFVISDASEDRDDDVVHLDGWDFAEHKRNPVTLWAHRHGTPAVGLGLGTHVDGEAAAVKSVLYANGKDVDPFGYMIGRMAALRIIRACSVGFIPKLYAFNDERGDWAIDFLKQELIEWSPCNVGCNRNALSEARSIGVDTGPFVLEAIKTLDGEGGLWLPRAEIEAIHADLTGRKLISIPDVAAFKASFAATVKSVARPPLEAAELPAGVERCENGDLVDWKAAAVDMSKGIAPSVAVRKHTFHKSEIAALTFPTREHLDAAALALQAEKEPEKKQGGGIDPSPIARENRDDSNELGPDEIRRLSEYAEGRLNDLATELTGRVL